MNTTTAADHELEDGWGADTPVDDTLLRRFVLSSAASWEAVAHAMDGRVMRDDGVVAADLGQPSGLFNAATLLRPLRSGDADERLSSIERFYDARGSGSVLLVSAWPTSDLRERGWERVGHPPMMLRPPSGTTEVTAPPDVRIVEVDDPRGLEDWCRVAVEGFPFEGLQPYRPGSLFDERLLVEQRLRLWVGYDGEEPVCIGTLFVKHGLGHFFLAVTLPRARRRGCYEAIARRRINAAPDLPLAALFSDMSRSPAERLGFLPLTRFTLWTRSRPPTQRPHGERPGDSDSRNTRPDAP